MTGLAGKCTLAGTGISKQGFVRSMMSAPAFAVHTRILDPVTMLKTGARSGVYGLKFLHLKYQMTMQNEPHFPGDPDEEKYIRKIDKVDLTHVSLNPDGTHTVGFSVPFNQEDGVKDMIIPQVELPSKTPQESNAECIRFYFSYEGSDGFTVQQAFELLNDIKAIVGDRVKKALVEQQQRFNEHELELQKLQHLNHHLINH
jgi:hypothetical protein